MVSDFNQTGLVSQGFVCAGSHLYCCNFQVTLLSLCNYAIIQSFREYVSRVNKRGVCHAFTRKRMTRSVSVCDDERFWGGDFKVMRCGTYIRNIAHYRHLCSGA